MTAIAETSINLGKPRLKQKTFELNYAKKRKNKSSGRMKPAPWVPFNHKVQHFFSRRTYGWKYGWKLNKGLVLNTTILKTEKNVSCSYQRMRGLMDISTFGIIVDSRVSLVFEPPPSSLVNHCKMHATGFLLSGESHLGYRQWVQHCGRHGDSPHRLLP